MFEQLPLQFAVAPAVPPSVQKHLWDYARLMAVFFMLYFQARILMAQNFILSCRLSLLELPLVYLKVQVFLTRLAQGFPVGQCWPGK